MSGFGSIEAARERAVRHARLAEQARDEVARLELARRTRDDAGRSGADEEE